MSFPNDAPAAAWYPDPKSPGYVRWWDGTNWTEHVSVPAAPVALQPAAIERAVAEPEAAPVEAAPVIAAPVEAAPEIYIGRHAAGPHPAPREAPRAPRIRPRERVERPVESLLYA